MRAYALDSGESEHVDRDLGLRIDRTTVNGRNARLLLSPSGRQEPSSWRFVVGSIVLLAARERISGTGQIVLTCGRVLGLVIDGMRDQERLSESTGRLVGFTLDRSDLASVKIAKTWLGAPKRVTFGGEDANSYALDLQIVAASIANRKAKPSNMKVFLEQMHRAPQALS